MIAVREPVSVNGHAIPALGAAKVVGESALDIRAASDAELLLV